VDETIIVDISSVTNGTESGIQQVTAAITDDDSPPTVAFSAPTSSGSESTTAVSVPVSLSTASSKSITVNYAVSGGTATGGGVDYTLASGTLTFAPGVTNQNISITVVNDALDEDDETIQITLSSPINATLGAIATHTYTILDNDPLPSLSINNVSVTEGNNNGPNPATFTITLSAVSGRTVTVNYATADVTATAPADYTAAPTTTLTFNPGETNKTVSVQIKGDTLNEPNETFTVNLSNPVNATITTANGIGTIIDDDSPPTVTLSLSGSPMVEAGGGATVTATSSAVSGQPVTVNLAFSGTATITNDYLPSASSIVIPAGSTTGTITLTAVQDSIDELDETIIVDISTVTNGTESGTQQVTAIITDDDLPPTVAFTAASLSGLENVTPAILPVSLSTVSAKTATVNYTVSGGTATGGGVDYTLASGTLVFAPGVTTQNISIAVVNDTLDENDETVLVTLSSPTNSTVGPIGTHTY